MKNDIKQCSNFFKKSLSSFGGSIASIVSAFNLTKCVSLSNQQCMIQPTLTNLHPNTLKNLDRCVETCNALNGLCLCLKWNKRFESNQSKKHISCNLKCKVDASQCDSNQKRNNDKCPREYKKSKRTSCVWKNIFGILLNVVAKSVVV